MNSPLKTPLTKADQSETFHACRITRAEFFIHKGICVGQTKKPNEKGYLVILNQGQPAESTLWCPHGSLDENKTTMINKKDYFSSKIDLTPFIDEDS